MGGDNVAGGKLKETGISHWTSPNTGATNVSGFTALPGGYRDNNASYALGINAVFWTTTPYDTYDAWYWYITSSSENIINNQYQWCKQDGFSVRCIKDALATVSTDATSGISETTAMSGGNVTYDGGLVVSARGVCWSTSHNPTILVSNTTDGSGTGTFTSNITGLIAGTTYYVRAYATNSFGTAYGEEVSFTISANINNGPIVYYPFNGNANDESGNNLNCTENNVISTTDRFGNNNKAYQFNGNGEITRPDNDLLDITNNFSISLWFNAANYQNQYILQKHHRGIDNDGSWGITIDPNGFVNFCSAPNYASSDNPKSSYVNLNQWYHIVFTFDKSTNHWKFYKNDVLDAQGTRALDIQNTDKNFSIGYDHFSSSYNSYYYFDGKIDDISIYNKVLAENEVDSLYHVGGWPIIPHQYAVHDFDGNGYDTVRIGTQTWLKQNLNVTHYRNGDDIPNVTDKGEWAGLSTGAYCNYNNDPNIAATYGRMYNWYIVADSRRMCPTDWHVSSNGEWTIMTDYLGGLNVAGGKLKETGLTHWQTPNTDATNETEFTALPGGYRFINGTFQFIGDIGTWWCSTENNATEGWQRAMYNNYRVVGPNSSEKVDGFSVRCIKDALATVSTESVSGITETTAMSGGNVTYDGGLAVTARGVCWSSSHNPTLSNSFTIDSSGVGSFTSIITGLTSGTTYYVRAYATNSLGTVYGNEVSFTTPQHVFTVHDIDGNGYDTVTIGTQTWLKQNLNVTHYRNGDAIPNVTDGGAWGGLTTGAYCNYNNDANIAAIYGRLYNWYTVADSRNMCPTDWHVPGDAEWSALTDYIGGLSIAGSKLKEAGTTHWNSPNTDATNVIGFTGLPAGDRDLDGSFWDLGTHGHWWSSNESDNGNAWVRFVYYTYNYALRYNSIKSYGFSVRCLKDQLSTVSTDNISNITETTAQCGGNVTSDGGLALTAKGVCWSSSHNPTLSNSFTIDSSGIGSFTSIITGLTSGTTYYVRAYATNSLGTAYGIEMSFTTFQTPTFAVYDYDGYGYDTVRIGTQTWLKQNLNVTHYRNGDAIPNVTDNVAWAGLTTGAYCNYNNDANYAATYGRLYNWYTVADSCNMCPIGWHVASLGEWTTLTDFVGGSNDAGAKLKETGNMHWEIGTSATNETGFTALGAGYRTFDATFVYTTIGTAWWSLNEYDPSSAWYQSMQSFNTYSGSGHLVKHMGYSVRCIKDVFATVNTDAASGVLETTAMIGGNVTSDGGLAVTARGVCWSTSHNPTLSNSFTIDSSGIGSFTSGINGLTSGTTYFVRAYATNSLGTAYGNEVSFTTAYSLLDGLVAYYPFNGNANDESGNGNNGTVYGANLTTDRFGNANSAYSFDGASYYIQTTSLSHTLTNKTYNAWVYLNDNNQIGGGLIGVQFNDASVFDAIVYNETNTGWGFGSDNFSRTKWSGMKETHYSWVMLTATYEQNTYKLYRNGILIDSTNQFSIINFPNTCKINIGIRHNNGDHAFINGTIDDVSVYNRTLSKLEIDSLYHEGGWPIISQQYQYAVYDYDGNGYDTVRIGTQTWMKQNLKVTHYRNGSEIPHRNVGNFYSYFDAGYCNYNDDDNIASVYGRLYNYYAAAHPLICPTGWHVPSLNEWGTLMDYVGGDLGKLKETGTAHWSYPNTGATNETGFTAIAGGYNYWGAGYHDIGLSCVFWSSTLYNTSNLAWNMGIYYKDNIGGPYYNGYSFGVSVRCIKDALATVSTEAASGVLGTTAMCGGNVTYDGGLVVTARGVCWSTSHNPTIADSYSEDGSGMGIFSSNLTGLSPCTTYYVRAYATNSLGTSYGNEISFSTILNAPVGDSIQTFYNAVTIADLVVTGNSIKWYDIQSGGNELLSTNSLVNGNTYYASQTIGGCESQSRFGVTVSLNLIKTVNLHLFLEGLFDPSTGNSMVEAQDIDWNAGITFAKYGSGVADKIQVDLFEENAPYNPIGVSISGIDLTTNGLATFQVSPSLIGNYYIRVRTRNHLETWSTIAVPFNTSPIVWDFTINAYNSFQASGGNDPQVQIAPGLYAFYLGDLDQSLNVDFDDFNLFEPYLTNGIYGFTIADFNGNGLCDFDDFNLFEPRLNEGPFAQYPGMP